jgi:hypothetical protein
LHYGSAHGVYTGSIIGLLRDLKQHSIEATLLDRWSTFRVGAWADAS